MIDDTWHLVSGLLTKKKEERKCLLLYSKYKHKMNAVDEVEEKEVLDKYVPFLPDRMNKEEGTNFLREN